MKKWIVAPLLSVSLLAPLTACDNQQVGTIAGATGGAVAGRALGGGTIGLILGAVVGGYLGGEAGQWLDERDRQRISATTRQALDEGADGQSYAWINPDTGNRGSVAPQGAAYATDSGATCRNFSQSASGTQGQSVTGEGVACKQADGSWKVVRG